MRVEREIIDHVTAGDLRVEIEAEPDGRPALVTAIVPPRVEGATSRHVLEDVSAELLERAAAVVRLRRWAAGDFRDVDPDRGYVVSLVPTAAHAAGEVDG